MSIQHLGQMTWVEAKDFVRESAVAVLPLGALEAHGPHLPLNTDVVISTEIARRAAKKIANTGKDLLICPPIVFSPAVHGAGFAGTVNVAGGAFSNYLRSILAELAGMGLKTVLLVTCHADGALFQAVSQCCQALAGMLGKGALRVVFPDLSKEPWVHLMPGEFRAQGSHAGHYETSCMMAIHAEHVREELRKKLPKVEANFAAAVKEGKAGFAACGGPQAYFGDPGGATSAHGEDYLEALATIYADALGDGAKTA